MKTLVYAMTLAALALASAGQAHAGPPLGVGVSFGIFYTSLSPHGEWISVDAGMYAWRPRYVDVGWRPYWMGRWYWTDDGWYWDSNEPWAWATYHYGRWYCDEYYGWIWIPGYDWAPAWVEWRYGGDYVGWAPLGPYACFNIHVGVYYSRHWVTPYHYWSFVDCGNLNYPNVNNYVYQTEQNTRFIGYTRTGGSVRYRDGRIIGRGPDRQYIERRGNARIDRAEINEVGNREQSRVSRVGDRDRIEVYRPRIEERTGENSVERPPQVREQERMPSLDIQGTDLGRRAESRDMRNDVSRLQRARPERLIEARPSTRTERSIAPRLRENYDGPEADAARRFESRIRDLARPPFEDRIERRDRSYQPEQRSTPGLPSQSENPERQMRERPTTRPETGRESARPSTPRSPERRRE